MSFPHSNTWTDPPSSSQRSIGWKTTATKTSVPFRTPRPDNGWASQLGSDSLPRNIPRIGGVSSFNFSTPTLDSEEKAASQFQQGELVARFDSRLEGVASGIHANRKALDAKSEQIMNLNQKNMSVLKEECKKLGKDIVKENQKNIVAVRDLLKKNNIEEQKSTKLLMDGINRVSRVVTELVCYVKQQSMESSRTRKIVELQREKIHYLGTKLEYLEGAMETFIASARAQKRPQLDNMGTENEILSLSPKKKRFNSLLPESEPSLGSPTVVALWDHCNQPTEPKEQEEVKEEKGGASSLGYLSETDDDDDSLFMQSLGKESPPTVSGEDSLFTDTQKRKRLTNPPDHIFDVYQSPKQADRNEETEFRGKTPRLRRRWRR